MLHCLKDLTAAGDVKALEALKYALDNIPKQDGQPVEHEQMLIDVLTKHTDLKDKEPCKRLLEEIQRAEIVHETTNDKGIRRSLHLPTRSRTTSIVKGTGMVCSGLLAASLGIHAVGHAFSPPDDQATTDRIAQLQPDVDRAHTLTQSFRDDKKNADKDVIALLEDLRDGSNDREINKLIKAVQNQELLKKYVTNPQRDAALFASFAVVAGIAAVILGQSVLSDHRRRNERAELLFTALERSFYEAEHDQGSHLC